MDKCSYWWLQLVAMTVGVKDLKNNLSHYLRRVAKGHRISVTAHGRVVAELGPPPPAPRAVLSRYQQLVADGLITPAREKGDPLEGIERLALRLPKGTAAALIEEDRRERDE